MESNKVEATGKMIHLSLAHLNRMVGVSDKHGIKVLMYFVDNYDAMVLIPEEMCINMLKDVTEKKLAACVKHNDFRGIEEIELLVTFDEELKEDLLHVQSYKVTVDETVDTGVKNKEVVELIAVPEYSEPQKGD